MSLASSPVEDCAVQPARRKALWSWLMDALAAAAGLVLGFDFGLGLAGPWLGIVMGGNAAIFAALMTSSLYARWAGSASPGV